MHRLPRCDANHLLPQFTGRSAGAGHVRSRELTYKRGDTFERMCGYCQKDEGVEGYHLHTEGVPDTVLQHGKEIYQAVGPNPQRERTLIKKGNLIVLAQVCAAFVHSRRTHKHFAAR